jgi:hypothetical protein
MPGTSISACASIPFRHQTASPIAGGSNCPAFPFWARCRTHLAGSCSSALRWIPALTSAPSVLAENPASTLCPCWTHVSCGPARQRLRPHLDSPRSCERRSASRCHAIGRRGRPPHRQWFRRPPRAGHRRIPKNSRYVADRFVPCQLPSAGIRRHNNGRRCHILPRNA